MGPGAEKRYKRMQTQLISKFLCREVFWRTGNHGAGRHSKKLNKTGSKQNTFGKRVRDEKGRPGEPGGL
jgi:hypothetical protein